MNLKKTSVTRRKEIQMLYAAKCRVAAQAAEPTEAEMLKSMLGDISMLNGNVRSLSKNILLKKGMLKPQTQQQKYEKVFSKFSLSPEQLNSKL